MAPFHGLGRWRTYGRGERTSSRETALPLIRGGVPRGRSLIRIGPAGEPQIWAVSVRRRRVAAHYQARRCTFDLSIRKYFRTLAPALDGKTCRQTVQWIA